MLSQNKIMEVLQKGFCLILFTRLETFFVCDSKCAVFTNIEIDERKCHLHFFSEIRKSLL